MIIEAIQRRELPYTVSDSLIQTCQTDFLALASQTHNMLTHQHECETLMHIHANYVHELLYIMIRCHSCTEVVCFSEGPLLEVLL